MIRAGGRAIPLVVLLVLLTLPGAGAQDTTTTTGYSENPSLRILRRSSQLRPSEVRLGAPIVSEISGAPVASAVSGQPIGASQVAQAERLASELGGTPSAEGLVVSLSERVLFDFGKADLRADARPVLEKVSALIRVRTGTVTISGHTDDRGSDAFNQELSERRATAVKGELERSFGVDPTRLAAQGRGETQPVAPNDSDDNRQKNRRVDIVIS